MEAKNNSDLLAYITEIQTKDFPNVPVALVYAVIETESSFNENAYRAEPQINDGSHGLMQILYNTAKWMGYSGDVQGLYDWKTNIYFGMKYISHLTSVFGSDNIEAIIMSYNEGEGNYKKGKRVNGYYAKVIARFEKWNALLS